MSSKRPRKTRIDDYLQAVERFSRDGGKASTGAVAKSVGVANGTASGMMRELAAAGLIDHQLYAGATLTDRGRRRLLIVLRKRQLLELFLHDRLQLEVDDAVDEACLLEPTASVELIERINQVLGGPRSDIRGDPIFSLPNKTDDHSD